VRSLGGSRAGEMRITRFLRNPKVTIEPMIEHAAAATLERVKGLHVLAIQDTSPFREDAEHGSTALHPTIGVDAEGGAVLGLVHGEVLRRRGGMKQLRKSRAFEDKESARWLRSMEASARLYEAGALRVTMLADRESDIYEAFAGRPAEVDLVVRASHDRALAEAGRLFAHVASLPEAGRICVDLPAAPGRRARHTELAIRFTEVKLKKPDVRVGGRNLPESLTLNLVEACEINPPDGVPPVHWRLLTTHAVDSLRQACWIISLYRKRWMIEELFRILKTRGFDLERVTIADEPYEKLAAAAMIAAVSVLQLTRERDGQAGRPLEDVFHSDERPTLEAVSETLEGKTAKQKNPHPKGSLAFAAWVCGRLGGWTGYYGKPGPIVMLKGLHRFRAIQQGWSIARNV